MKSTFKKFVSGKISLLFSIFCLFSAPEIVSAQTGAIKFDDFNRANNNIIGVPASGGTNTWLETESASSNNYRVRIENNLMVLGSYNSVSSGVGSSAMEQASFEVSNRYATIFNQATSTLNWYFNMRQSRTAPSGFGSGFYGVAYVLGSTEADFSSANASGYAVVIGQAGTSDPVKLVRFTGGLNANSNLINLITTTETASTSYFSIKVSFDPCSKTWSLQVRNDGTTAFADPLTLNITPLSLADQTFTNSDLKYIGAAFSHGTANEKAYFDNLSLPDASIAAPVTYNWTGAISTAIDEPGNWFPNRTCNRLTDILTVNTGQSTTITNVSNQEIARLIVSNNSTLILKAKTGATQTLSIVGGTNEDLLVEAGSNLIIDSNDPLELSLKSGATGKISGNITFQNTSGNLGRAHRLLATDEKAITFENGSQFIAKNLSGEPFGNAGTANVAVFKANSVYISRDGASPFGLATPNSKVIFETGSLYKHEQTGTAPKFDGRVYGDFELNVTNSLAIIFGTSAATPTRIDNFTISSGTMNVTLASGATPLPLNIKGNLLVAPGAVLNFNPSAVANTSLITFNGTTKQQLSGTINLGQFANLEINNAAGVNLNSNLTIKGNLQFTAGIFTYTNAANLFFGDNATVSGASNNSYVAGKVNKTGDDAFIFPTGKNGFYAPIAISAPANTTDQYAAEYFTSDPVNTFGLAKNDSLVMLSNSEYWDLERTIGNSEVKVSLSYDPARSLNVTNPENLRIAHFKDGNGWVNEGRSAVSNSPGLSLHATKNAQASFSPFTFGSISGNNPLPVELSSFTADFKNNEVNLNWETASEKNNDRFEIERSTDGKHFAKIGELKGQGNSNSVNRYVFFDKYPNTGLNYYRLKQLDFDGSFKFSPIKSVNNEKISEQISVKLFPNPATDLISLSSNTILTKIEILNILGQVVKTIKLKSEEKEIQLGVEELSAGSYFIKVNEAQPLLKLIKSN